jgi:hypothetical protein
MYIFTVGLSIKRKIWMFQEYLFKEDFKNLYELEVTVKLRGEACENER